MITGKCGKFATKRRKFTKRGKKVRLSRGRRVGGQWDPRRVGRVGGEGGRAAAGRGAQWGPRRVADPVGKGGRAAAARAARSGAEGQHESSGGRARRNGGSARGKRRPRPPRVSTREAEAAAMGAKMPLLMGDQAGRGDHCGKVSSWRRIFLRNNREETRQATSAMGKASQTSSSTPVSEKRYATGMRMIS